MYEGTHLRAFSDALQSARSRNTRRLGALAPLGSSSRELDRPALRLQRVA